MTNLQVCSRANEIGCVDGGDCAHLRGLEESYTALKVSNLANASSLIYSSLAAYDKHFGMGDKAVNWCGMCSLLRFRVVPDQWRQL